MAAGLGFKTFTTGEVLTAGDVNGYLMQGINVFATTTARNAAITAPAEGQFAFTKDNNSLWYYDGAAWVASGATGDIEGVTAGTGISGGGTSGTVTVSIDTAVTVDKTTAQVLTNKTLTNPLINPTISTQASAYTLVAADQGTLIQMSATSSVALTLPPSVFAAGAQLDVIATGVAGTITFTQGSGVTILSTGAVSTAPKLRVIYSAATIICKTGGASPVFYVVGDIS